MSGIYIHIPFCKQACHYCNFHFSTSLKYKDDFIDALVKEIELTSVYEDLSAIETVYFGGGTPSIIEINDINKILEAIRRKWIIANNAEITLEANPDDISSHKLKQWKEVGINRLSVGIQSFNEEELKWMNRAHTAAESLECIDEIIAAGFHNFSIDLIYGSPLLSNEQWKQNVDIVIEKKIPHISCYALTVETKTALDKMIQLKKKQPVDAEKQAEQFLLLMQWMKDAGYEHYEISNYALPGFRSKHNSSYWNEKKYYGFGPSAHAYDGKIRSWNIANNIQYIKALQNGQLPNEKETLTPTQQLNEYIMTSLRTMEGIDLKKMEERFGSSNKEKLIHQAQKHIAAGNAFKKDDKIILTDVGKLFADGIAADLFF